MFIMKCFVFVDCLVDKFVIWIVFVLCFFELFCDIMLEFDGVVDIEFIYLGFDEVVCVICECLVSECCDVVILVGFNGVYFKSCLLVLVVVVCVSGFDVMQVLVCVCQISVCIGLVIYQEVMLVLIEFQQMFGFDIVQCIYVIEEDVCVVVQELKVGGVQVVVGVGFIIDLVEEVGMQGIFFYFLVMVWQVFEDVLELVCLIQLESMCGFSLLVVDSLCVWYYFKDL